jgi:hypothetical protein
VEGPRSPHKQRQAPPTGGANTSTSTSLFPSPGVFVPIGVVPNRSTKGGAPRPCRGAEWSNL